jgi:F-type H+-transporting ATPase subunit b
VKTSRVLVSGGAVVAVVLAASSPAVAAPKPTEVSKCVQDAVQTGQQADTCLKAPNPILPDANELIWGSISFVLLLVLLWKVALPPVRKAMAARTERIHGDLDAADHAKVEAQTVLEEYRRQLADAKNEANRIIEESRQTADQLRKDLVAKAEADATELRQRATADIEAAKERALTELRTQLATLAIDLAEKVVEHNLDRPTNEALVERYIAQVGSGGRN